MSSLYHEYLVDDREFTSYEDFKNNCKLKTKPDFNFAYDIVDKYATDFPGKRGLMTTTRKKLSLLMIFLENLSVLLIGLFPKV